MRMGSELLSKMKKFTPDLAKVFSVRMSWSNMGKLIVSVSYTGAEQAKSDANEKE